MTIKIKKYNNWEELLSASNIKWHISKNYKEIKSYGNSTQNLIEISPTIHGLSFDINESNPLIYDDNIIEIYDTNEQLGIVVQISIVNGKTVIATAYNG